LRRTKLPEHNRVGMQLEDLEIYRRLVVLGDHESPKAPLGVTSSGEA